MVAGQAAGGRRQVVPVHHNFLMDEHNKIVQKLAFFSSSFPSSKFNVTFFRHQITTIDGKNIQVQKVTLVIGLILRKVKNIECDSILTYK